MIICQDSIQIECMNCCQLFFSDMMIAAAPYGAPPEDSSVTKKSKTLPDGPKEAIRQIHPYLVRFL